jgi:hypothetical protein
MFFLSSVILSKIVELGVIKEIKHGERRNGLDNRKCENKQFSWIPTFVRSGCNYFKNAIIIGKKIKRNLFVSIVITRKIRI